VLVGSQNSWRRREFCTSAVGLFSFNPVFASHQEDIGSGTALLLRLRDRGFSVADNPSVAQRMIFPPGSTVKPFSLLALLENGRLSPDEGYLCPGRLTIAGRSFNCSHPPSPLPMNVSRAIAYSCNCAVAHFAERFGSGDLSHSLQRNGLASLTGLLPGAEASGFVTSGLTGPACTLQALGEEGVQVTALEILGAYRRLANRVGERMVAPILEGLEGAVEFGTAQAARLDRVRVAGKTGSIRTAHNGRGAWFAGFAPSRSPEVAVTVLVAGWSGGADAAPIAGRLLERYFASRT
jgi:penicillin-binding protein 2